MTIWAWIVQCRSTVELGGVARLSLYVGTRNDAVGVDAGTRVYAATLWQLLAER